MYNSVQVLDYGALYSKIGMAGEDQPLRFLSVLNHDPITQSTTVGSEEQHNKNKLRFPIHQGIIENFQQMHTIWKYSFDKLQTSPEQTPCLISESYGHKDQRKAICEYMFESFDKPALCLSNSAVLSLLADGRESGVVIDCGHSQCSIVPIYEGYQLPHAIMSSHIAGNQIDDLIRKNLQDIDLSQFKNPRQLIRNIKKSYCYIPIDYDQELKNISPKIDCKLPDGQILKISKYGLLSPQTLFNPVLSGKSLASLPLMIYNCIMKCDVQIRNMYFMNLVLSGGTSLIKGLTDRLCYELYSLAPVSSVIKIKLQKYSDVQSWIGGSILGSLSTFQDRCLTKAQYQEEGENSIKKKFY